ncbi:enoyl-CoA hydratase [Roseivivax lentus]|uniref:Enoyl-CoA hydratase n=2 Tax=Roseivivax lentus TaxID=633194 RepID=A0A1N7PRJ3_9RHOB|nr:enoyl-CoA hydratase [Roseivivax lentus]
MDRHMSDTEELAGGKLQVTRRAGVVRIVFNNPDKRNAMTLAMWQGLGDLCAALAEEDGLRVVTLEGAGERAFVAGADISEFAQTRGSSEAADAYNAAVARAERLLEAVPVPTLALVRGSCVGGGLGIAMRCDLRLARADARFGITPAKLGLGYGFEGVASLNRRLGHAVTADLLFTGRLLPAEEAQARGICDFVHPGETFEAECAAYVDTISANAPLTIRTAKAALLELAKAEADQDPARIARMIETCYNSDDYQEGQRAFAEKRAPVFKGR